MSLRAGEVENHPAQCRGVRELLIPEHRGRRAARHAGNIDHQQDGCAQQPCDLRRGAAVIVPVRAIEQPHHSFHHRDVGIPGCTCERLPQLLVAQHPGIEIAAGAARSPLVIAGIDVIRAALEGLHRQTTGTQGRDEPGGDRRLADVGRRSRDDYTGNSRIAAQNSIPACARTF